MIALGNFDLSHVDSDDYEARRHGCGTPNGSASTISTLCALLTSTQRTRRAVENSPSALSCIGMVGIHAFL